MSRTEFMRALAELGFPAVCPGLVDYALKAGHVDEPPRDSRGNRVFTRVHVDQMADYLGTPRRTGRPRSVSAGGADQ